MAYHSTSSLRAQTLYRTVSGTNYSKAIKLLYRVENPELVQLFGGNTNRLERELEQVHFFREHWYFGRRGCGKGANVRNARILFDVLDCWQIALWSPDFLNALYMITRGGVSKAQKGLLLNEDINAGMNAFGRGGRKAHRVLSMRKGRDLGFGTNR